MNIKIDGSVIRNYIQSSELPNELAQPAFFTEFFDNEPWTPELIGLYLIHRARGVGSKEYQIHTIASPAVVNRWVKRNESQIQAWLSSRTDLGLVACLLSRFQRKRNGSR